MFIISVIFLAGCATTLKYPFDKNLYRSEQPLKYRVVVDLFEDERPSKEHYGAVNKQDIFLYTSDQNFKPDIDMQISQMLIEHFKKANIFLSVELKNVYNKLDESTEKMEMIDQEGVDLVILGKVKHFYGYQSGSSGGAVAFGALGVLTEAIANPKEVGGHVEYGDIKIIDVHNKKVLWQGDIAHEFEEKDTFYDGPPAYALRALKETNDKLTKKIRDVL